MNPKEKKFYIIINFVNCTEYIPILLLFWEKNFCVVTKRFFYWKIIPMNRNWKKIIFEKKIFFEIKTLPNESQHAKKMYKPRQFHRI